jgi:hypothetical protein
LDEHDQEVFFSPCDSVIQARLDSATKAANTIIAFLTQATIGEGQDGEKHKRSRVSDYF